MQIGVIIAAIVEVWIVCFWLLGLALYFLPSFIAFDGKKKSRWVIVFWNLMLGWTVAGWVACLIWAFLGQQIGAESLVDQLKRSQDRRRAMRDSEIRHAAEKAASTGFPEDQELLRAMIADYRAEYGTDPHAVREALTARAESERSERRALLQQAEALEKQYFQAADPALLPRIKELRERAKGH